MVVLGPMLCARAAPGRSSEEPTTSRGAVASAPLRNERRRIMDRLLGGPGEQLRQSTRLLSQAKMMAA